MFVVLFLVTEINLSHSFLFVPLRRRIDTSMLF